MRPSPRSIHCAMLLVFAGAACTDYWGSPHTPAPTLIERPECPTTWGPTIPWLDQRQTVSERRLPPGGIPGAGPITNIPEFHDCQRFLSADGVRFDSLFAIFSFYRQDSIVGALGWDSLTWTSGNAAVATVSGGGLVTGVSAGTALIKAVGAQGATAARDITVLPSPGASGPGSIDMHRSGPDTIYVGEMRSAVASFGEPTSETLPVATVYAYAQQYTSLGIEPNFNCLYLYFDNSRRLRAKMVPASHLGPEIDACLNQFNPQSAAGKDLAVVRTTVAIPGETAASLYPPVARWDWGTENRQIMGVGCGDAWCIVGEAAASGAFSPPPGYVLGAGASAPERRVVEVKGWHDEQVLAAPDPGDPEKLRPSAFRGTVIPHPDLASQEPCSNGTRSRWCRDGTRGWRVAAYLAMTDLSGGGDPAAVAYYATALGIAPTPAGTLNTVNNLNTLNEMSYCFGTRNECPGVPFWRAVRCIGLFDAIFARAWWSMVTRPSGGEPTYFCVVRRTHEGVDDPHVTVPATARWRWILRDDTVWTECVQGCCETQGF